MTRPIATKASALQAQQQALVTALFAHPGEPSALASLWPQLEQANGQCHRGLKAYQANGHALAESGLRAAFPVVEQMLGAANFNGLAHDLWHRHPPEQGDLARWGAALPSFLATHPQLAGVPYLGDVAQVEWALHRAAFESDSQPDPASFARLSQEDPETLALTLATGLRTVASRFPVASLVLAHLQNEPSLAEAADRLRQGQAETALIWRQGMKPRLMRSSTAAAALVGQLQSGNNLASALDHALTTTDGDGEQAFDFSAWLSDSVTNGVVIGIHTAHRPAGGSTD